jgi:hypothetical protein
VEEKNGKRWVVEIEVNGERYKKSFSFRTKKEELVAEINANQWREEKSDELKITKTEIVPLSHLQPISVEIQKYIGGFVDGDGCIMMSKQGSLQVEFSQSSDTGIPAVLLFIQNLYGGKILSKDPGGDRTTRKTIYELNIMAQEDVWHIIPVLCTYCIVKKPQAIVAQAWLKSTEHETKGIPSNDPTRMITHETLKTLKDMYEYVEVDEKDLNDHYLAGLTDAEGCVRMAGTVRVSICKASCVNMLNAIQRFLGVGLVSKCKQRFWCYADNAVKLIERLLPYSIVKKAQYELALKWRKLQTENNTRDPVVKMQLDQLAEQCSRAKHPAKYKRPKRKSQKVLCSLPRTKKG